MALANPFIFIWLFGKRQEGSWKFWKLALTYSRCFSPSLIWWKQEKAINIRTYVPYCFLWRAIRMLSWINGSILVSYVGYGIKGAVPYDSLSCLASFLFKRCVGIKCCLLCCQKKGNIDTKGRLLLDAFDPSASQLSSFIFLIIDFWGSGTRGNFTQHSSDQSFS